MRQAAVALTVKSGQCEVQCCPGVQFGGVEGGQHIEPQNARALLLTQFNEPLNDPFDRDYMNKLYRTGFEAGLSSSGWRSGLNAESDD